MALEINESLLSQWNEGNVRGMSRSQQEKYMERSASWPGLHTFWKPKKILGAGGNGVCGLWENTYDHDDHSNANSADFPQYLVIKQSRTPTSLNRESKFLRLLGDTGCEHVVKLYRTAHATTSSGASLHYDPLPMLSANGQWSDNVSRMYMEYCQGGDLYGQYRDPDSNFNLYNVPVVEEYLWRFLKCMASALTVMENGQLGPKDPNWTSIIHLDIKGDNILIGDHDANHPRLNVFKLADFGLSQAVPGTGPVPNPNPNPGAQNTTNQAWINDVMWRATPKLHAPEQLDPQHPQRTQIGTPTNVWGIGVMLYYLMTRHELRVMDDTHVNGIRYRADEFIVNNLISYPAGPLRTYGRRLWRDARPRYSWNLIEIVYKCLAYNPSERMNAYDLWNEASAAVQAYNQENARTFDTERRVFNDQGREKGNVLLTNHNPPYTTYNPPFPLPANSRGAGGPVGGGAQTWFPQPQLLGNRWNYGTENRAIPLLWSDNIPGYPAPPPAPAPVPGPAQAPRLFSPFADGGANPPANPPPAPPVRPAGTRHLRNRPRVRPIRYGFSMYPEP